MEINERIKARRLELGLTLKDVADALNVAESTVSRYETSNIQNMGIDKIKTLADVLKCSPEYLMGWETASPPGIDYHVGELLVMVRQDPNLRELVRLISHLNNFQQENLLNFVRSMQPDEHPEQGRTNNQECN